MTQGHSATGGQPIRWVERPPWRAPDVEGRDTFVAIPCADRNLGHGALSESGAPGPVASAERLSDSDDYDLCVISPTGFAAPP